MSQGVRLIEVLQATGQLLGAEAWQEAVPQVLGRIGEGVKASCVHVLENSSPNVGARVARSRWGWAAPESGSSRPAVLSLDYGEPGADRWAQVLEGGGTVLGPAEGFHAPERELLIARQAQLVALVPIFSGAAWWGSLWVDRRAAEPDWAPEELGALEFAAKVLETAILRQELRESRPGLEHDLRVQTERDLRRTNDRLANLHELDQAILAARLPEEIARASLECLERILPCERASVVLFDRDFNEGQILALGGHPQETLAEGQRVAFQDAGITESLQRGQAILVEDLAALESPTNLQARLGSLGIRTYLSVPLLSRGSLIGALNLGAAKPGGLPAEAQEIAREVADSLAVGIQNARLFEQVRAGRERLQALSQRLVEVQEAERRSLARELHDQIGQLLTGLKLIIEMSARAPAPAMTQNLEEAKTLVNELMERVRELSLDLRPAMLDDLGLLPALLWLFERYGSQTQVKVAFRHSGVEERRFQPEVETTAYRIVQEALTNVARHAQVEQAWVRLRADDELLYIQVEDRGKGFDPEAVLVSGVQSGLSGMRERAVLARGQLVIESRPDRGTLVSAELPLHGYLERRGRQR